MRTLTYYVACSADGFISREDGGLGDFSFDGEHVADLLDEFPETIPTHLRQDLKIASDNRSFDTVLMGRRTYEVGLDTGITSPYRHLDQYVFSTTMGKSPDAEVALVADDPTDHVRELKSRDGLGIWLCGGSELASCLFDEIDRLIIKFNPFLMGAGKPMFARSVPKVDLKLLERRDYPNGFSLLKFEKPGR